MSRNSDVVLFDAKKEAKKKMIRLANGTVIARRVGRMPVGSVLLDSEGNPVGEPVKSTAKPRAKTFLRLADGTVIDATTRRGRRPRGSVQVEDPSTGFVPPVTSSSDSV